ncbi:hypothetical protein, partial [Leptospira santarosai]
FAELNDTALYGSQRPLTLFAELNDTALYGSQRPLTLFAELNDTALYGSQRQGNIRNTNRIDRKTEEILFVILGRMKMILKING